MTNFVVNIIQSGKIEENSSDVILYMFNMKLLPVRYEYSNKELLFEMKDFTLLIEILKGKGCIVKRKSIYIVNKFHSYDQKNEKNKLNFKLNK